MIEYIEVAQGETPAKADWCWLERVAGGGPPLPMMGEFTGNGGWTKR